MHSLVPAILLRFTRLDPLHSNAQSQPPDRELTQSTGSGGGERRPIVGPDHIGQAELAKRGVKDVFSLPAVGLREGLAAQKIATIGVEDGQRIALGAIVRLPPAF